MNSKKYLAFQILAVCLLLNFISCSEGDPFRHVPTSLNSDTHYLKCNSNPMALKAGQSVDFSFEKGTDTPQPTYALEDSNGDPSTLGSFTVSEDGMAITYVAPSSISSASLLQIMATTPSDPATSHASCALSLISDDIIGIVDDHHTQGAVGNVVKTPVGTTVLPSPDALDALTPIQTILVPNFDYPRRSYTNPIPGTQPQSWYAIIFQAQLKFDNGGQYKFEVQSDDGSAFYLDGNLLINLRDHATPTQTSASVSVTAGLHSIRIDYGQWDGPNLGLQLWWQMADSNGLFDASRFVIVPADHVFRPNASSN